MGMALWGKGDMFYESNKHRDNGRCLQRKN